MILFFGIAEAFACSCSQKPTVLDAFESAELVVEARLVSAEKIPEGDPPYTLGGIRSFKWVIERSHKGGRKAGSEITIAQGSGSDCAFTFGLDNIGLRYLFYLDDPSWYPRRVESDNGEMVYHTSFCGRSIPVDGAFDDLAYLNNIEKARGRTRISGLISGVQDLGFNKENIKVRIVGKEKTYETRTDKNGFYEIYDVPAGDYFIRPSIPFGWKLSRYFLGFESSSLLDFDDDPENAKFRVPIRLAAGRHAGLNLNYTVDNSISGRILSPDGKPMTRVCLKAESTDPEDSKSWPVGDCTNDEGEYTITTLKPGNYRLVLNSDGKIDRKEPFGTVYFPGVTNPRFAGAVSVGFGKFLNNVDIQIPTFAELITISGQLLYDDEVPIPGEIVQFTPKDKEKFTDYSITTDSEGRFEISIPKGVSGELISKKWLSIDQSQNCPKLEKLLGEQRSGALKADPVEILGDSDMQNIKLVFPFPHCQKE